MKSLSWILACLATVGCVTLSGNYVLNARDKSGKNLLGQTRFGATGRGIYTVRNALCMNHPGAVVVITDATSGEELKSESPYQCP